MKRIITTGFLWGLIIPLVFSQNRKNTTGGVFIKNIEYNMVAGYGDYNPGSKGIIEKLFWENFNAPVEFFYGPSSECKPAIPSGFRIVKDSLNGFYLEVKYISNFKEATKEINERYPTRLVSINESWTLPKDTVDSILDNNRAILKKNFEERVIKLYKVNTESFHISNQFAEKLYEKMVSFIGNFKATGIPGLSFDGYSVTFRTVVEDEVWSLNIHMPQGEALKMADLCRKIIADAEANQLDESKYMQLIE